MDKNEMEKSTGHITTELIGYEPRSVVTKTILKKSTGSISVMSFDKGQGLAELISPFDSFVQIIDGKADIVISGKSHLLHTGQSIVIPAHTPNFVRPDERFKLIKTVIKSGYE